MVQAGGISFLRTADLELMSRFCQEVLSMGLWVDQGQCRIFRRAYWLMGFIESKETVETSGIFTLFLPSRQDVDREYEQIRDWADAAPRVNDRFGIYQFFIKDPEGRLFEIQSFEHPIDWSFA